MGAAKQHRLLQAGSRAPEFQLDDLRGGKKTLEQLLPTAPVLLAFFKVTCPVCQFTFPYIERIFRSKGPDSFQMFGISQDDDESTREFLREFGVTFPTLLDREEESYPASNAYGIAHVPTMFLVGKDGTISWVLDGWSKQEIALLAAKAGVDPFHVGEKVAEWKSG